MSQNKTLAEVEESFVKRIEELSYLVNGLDNYDPYLKAIDRFKQTRDDIDRNWHLVMDKNKLDEIRLSKMAANSIINFVNDLKYELEMLQKELIMLRNPDLVVNKDYDPN